MKIAEYLKLTKEKPYHFARRAGIGYALAYALHKGEKTNLKTETVLKVVAATDGAVQFQDLIT